jgi:hypothetical protein
LVVDFSFLVVLVPFFVAQSAVPIVDDDGDEIAPFSSAPPPAAVESLVGALVEKADTPAVG